VGALATVVPSAYLSRSVRGALVLPNWTDDLVQLPQPPAREQERVTIGYLGRVGREKGTDVLAAACRLLAEDVRSRARLLVAGDDRFVPEGDRQVVDAALGDAGVPVERPGWIDPLEFFAAVDVAVFPSVRPESFGLAAAEAMAAGRPVVVSDSGGLPEVVGAGHPWVVPHGDPSSLSRTLAEALAALPAREVVTQQRLRWEREYSPAAGRRHLTDLLGRLPAPGLSEARP
jgi:glycosyltransferase involved in cell wall biosynthesis